VIDSGFPAEEAMFDELIERVDELKRRLTHVKDSL
jgi:hypothetical protein